MVSSSAQVPIHMMVKRYRGATYLFAVVMRNGATRGTFKVRNLPAKATAEVLGENRSISVVGGKLEDAFQPYDVHLYRIVATSP